jgi:hypothetical protein
MDVLRARAYLDLLLGKDSRPRQDAGGDGAGLTARQAGQVRTVRAARRSRRDPRLAWCQPGSPGR